MIASNIVTIVPFYNRRHLILAALDSIQAQTLRPAQLIVVDDGSIDGGGETVRQWMRHNGGSLNCRLIEQANSGVAAARNRALAEARPSEFVAFLDSDDVWPPDFLQRASAALTSCPAAVAATCDQQYLFSDGTPSVTVDNSAFAFDPRLWMLKIGAGICSASLFRTQGISRRGGFPALVTGEDAALFLPLSLDGPWLHVLGTPVDYHVGLAGQLGDEGNLSRKFTDNWRHWARIYEEFLSGDGGCELVRKEDCKELMAVAWYRAGKELWDTHSPRDVLSCFVKSFAWNPWQRRCYWRMLRAWLKTLKTDGISRSFGSGAATAAAF